MENTDNQTIPVEGSDIKKEKSSRSASYPSLTINDAYDFADKINQQFSSVATVTREEIAKALKKNAGSIIRDISSCVQYGFLDKNTAEGKYQITPLFTDIFKPDSEKDKKIALIKAFGLPKLNSELITKFENNVLPNELPNNLVKYHGIRDEVAQSAADIFVESGKYVGVINENRVLKYAVTLSTISKTQYAEIIDVKHNGEQSNGTEGNLPAKIETYDFANNSSQQKKPIAVPIYLTKNKVAVFTYPDDITANDVALVKHQLEGILLKIQFEALEKE